MSRDDFRTFFQELAHRFLSHSLDKQDGVSERELVAAEGRLGIRIPAALRAYYLCAGSFVPFSSIHNMLRPPEELHIEHGYLVYMDENQNVVSWGLRQAELDQDDPVVWQRNNAPPEEWFSEEKPFTALMLEMFEWYEKIGAWAPGMSLRAPA